MKKIIKIVLTCVFVLITALIINFNQIEVNDNLESEEDTKIVIIGHLYPLFKQEYLSILKKQIQEIKGLKGVVLAGDIVPRSEEKHYDLLKKELIDYIKVPFYYIPANHEMSDNKIFQHQASQFSKLYNQNIYVGKTKYILYSVHKQNERPARSNFDCNDISELKKLILESNDTVDNTYLILADLKCFKRPGWKQLIHPLIKKHVSAVVIGDNASTKYNYTWEEYDGVPYIFQGIAHRGHGLSGDNTFLVIQKDDIQLQHLKIEKALDQSYQTKNKFRKLVAN